MNQPDRPAGRAGWERWQKPSYTLGVAALVAGTAALALAIPPDAPGRCHYRLGGRLPDRGCTPGAINHDVTPATIRATICKPGWTKTVRPPTSVTEPIKQQTIRAYGYRFGTSPAGYELDHLIPLQLGGATSDRRNLWPEPHHPKGGSGAFDKDTIEGRLRRLVCAGRVTLGRARRIMRTDWRLAARL